MSLLQLWFGQVFFGGFAGLLAFMHIAWFRTSQETFDSPRCVRRWTYRYLLFSLAYLGSFLLSPVFIYPAMERGWDAGLTQDVRQALYPLALLPLAAVFFTLNLWFVRKFDHVKVRARKRAGWSNGDGR